jgi:hypothetical protein
MYKTCYKLKVIGFGNDKEENKAIINELNDKIEKLNLFGYAFDRDPSFNEDHPEQGLKYWTYDSCSWDDHFHDMRDISFKFPQLTFKLKGTGDDPDDRWYTLFKNGMFERVRAVLTWPEPKLIKWNIPKEAE